MIGKDVALEGLSALCNAKVTSVQEQKSQAAHESSLGDGQTAQQLHIKRLIPTIVRADDSCEVSRSSFIRLQSSLQSGVRASGPDHKNHVDIESLIGPHHIIDEDEFFDPGFDYDFTNLKDKETYHRGGEVYERPCGWQRFALNVLHKYDENTWLGNNHRSTQSVQGEWPVSYHGTSKSGSEAIIEGYYKPGPGEVYGRGIYSTPYMAEAIPYTKTFTSKKTGKTYRVVLQNRISPEYRLKYNNDSYWLIPISKGTNEEEEHRMVERAIRPYGLLLQEVTSKPTNMIRAILSALS